jgi:hypothetical protein
MVGLTHKSTFSMVEIAKLISLKVEKILQISTRQTMSIYQALGCCDSQSRSWLRRETWFQHAKKVLRYSCLYCLSA